MKPLAIFAATVVTLALISYSIAIITEQRKKLVVNRVLIFLTLGVVLDISATTMMIIVSENSPFTLHGILGYSSLTLMLIDAVSALEIPDQQGCRHCRFPSGSSLFQASLYLVGDCLYHWNHDGYDEIA